MLYEDSINKIVFLVQTAPNEADTRVEARKILKRFLITALYSGAELQIMDACDDMDMKIGGTD